MTDQTQAQTGVEVEQPAPMPSADQQPGVSKEVEGAGSQEASTPDQSEPTLPEGARERTQKEFEKLKSQLAQERERRTRYERMFQPVPQSQPNQSPTWFDPQTGMVKVDDLNRQMTTLQQQLDTAHRTLQSVQAREDDRQAKAAYKAHPTLDPSRDDFNESFHKAVVGYLAGEYAEGRTPSMKQAADEIKRIASSDVKKAEASGAKRALEQLTPKEQASMEAESRSDKRSAVGDLESLRERTRHGDKDAILERLKSLPPVGR